MAINSVMSNGLAGIYQGTGGMARNSHEIARETVAEQNREDSRRTEALIESRENLQLVQANAKSVQAGSDTIGTLLDIKV